RGGRLRLAGEAVAPGLFPVGDGEAHHPAVGDGALDDLRPAPAARPPAAAMRDVQPRGGARVAQRHARRTLVALAGVENRDLRGIDHAPPSPASGGRGKPDYAAASALWNIAASTLPPEHTATTVFASAGRCFDSAQASDTAPPGS